MGCDGADVFHSARRGSLRETGVFDLSEAAIRGEAGGFPRHWSLHGEAAPACERMQSPAAFSVLHGKPGEVQDHCSNRLHGVAMREWAKKEKCVFSSASFASMLFTSRCRALPPSVFCEEPLFLHGKPGEVQVHPAHFMALPREDGPSGSFRRAARIVRRCLRSMSQLFVENLFFIQNHKKAAEAFFTSASAANVMLFYS